MTSPSYQLSDARWETVRAFLPPNGRRGRPWKDHRVVIDGILWALSDGGRWRNVPDRFGNWKTVYERFRRWSQEGLWDEALDELQVRVAASGRVDWELFAVDGPVVRAHRSAAGALKKRSPEGEPAGHALGPSRGGFSTKGHLVAALDEKGMLPEKLAGDKGYSAKWIRAYLLAKGIDPAIPHRKAEPGRAGPFDRRAYRQRNLIERGISFPKWLRRVATRYEKLAVHYPGMLEVAILFRFYLG
ncbi:MAG: IS5 family transposase [Gemmataceae bacterium]|nr:IS5 family transposase [Gemmataceae bacterium]